MHILFIYSTTKTITCRKPLKGQEDIYFGISYISSVLRENGHSTSLVVLDRKYSKKNYRTVARGINRHKPEVVCFTAVNSEFPFICGIANFMKENYPTIFRVVGGVQVSINPREEYLDIFDALCIGEGEYPTLELVTSMQAGKSILEIPNFWFKHGESIIKNAPRPFIENISQLPFPDRKMWQKWILRPNSRFTLLLGRGCPFSCTYCCNHRLKRIAPGRYVRLRDVQNIVDELNALTVEYPCANDFYLEVETCGIDPKWLIDLCEELYKFNQQFETPKTFATNLRVFPNIDDEAIFRLLKRGNFTAVSIGLESGNDRVRREILRREYSNDDIRRVIGTARRYGIKVGIYNLVGIPGETHEEFLDTLAMNQELQPDWHATSIFFPYEGTDLHQVATDMGVLPPDLDFNNERQRAVLHLPGFPKLAIQHEFDAFHFNVYKKSHRRNPLKMLVFFAQIYLGHNFMAEAKLGFFRCHAVLLRVWQIALTPLRVYYRGETG
jgi:radical SAM superfamily enzyme YgiQ (UPF0313 family)